MNQEAALSVALIEDDAVLGRSLVQRLRLAGVATHWVRSAAEGEALLRRHRPTMVLCDIRLPDESGEALIARLMPELGTTPVVVMTAYGGIEQAVRLMRLGVDDYLAKPFPVQQLLHKLSGFAELQRARADPEAGAAGAQGMPGWRSPPMRALHSLLGRTAETGVPVLITGESGAGKGYMARMLHGMGSRAQEPFVVVDCAALPAELAQAEAVLLGQEGVGQGSAAEEVPGLVGQAGAGTLFLDEIAELSTALQARLLRLVEEQVFLPVGARRPRPFRARIVAATHADLRSMTTRSSFRQDLWFRLSVLDLIVPPLRDRPEDIDELACYFLRRVTGGRAETSFNFAADGLAALRAHSWPGNLRELRNRIERAALFAATSQIGAADLFPERSRSGEPPDAAAGPHPVGQPMSSNSSDSIEEGRQSLAEARDLAERQHISLVLAEHGGRLGDAARALGVSRTTLWDRMRRLGLKAR